jgi:hypothetical protein
MLLLWLLLFLFAVFCPDFLPLRSLMQQLCFVYLNPPNVINARRHCP